MGKFFFKPRLDKQVTQKTVAIATKISKLELTKFQEKKEAPFDHIKQIFQRQKSTKIKELKYHLSFFLSRNIPGF